MTKTCKMENLYLAVQAIRCGKPHSGDVEMEHARPVLAASNDHPRYKSNKETTNLASLLGAVDGDPHFTEARYMQTHTGREVSSRHCGQDVSWLTSCFEFFQNLFHPALQFTRCDMSLPTPRTPSLSQTVCRIEQVITRRVKQALHPNKLTFKMVRLCASKCKGYGEADYNKGENLKMLIKMVMNSSVCIDINRYLSWFVKKDATEKVWS